MQINSIDVFWLMLGCATCIMAVPNSIKAGKAENKNCIVQRESEKMGSHRDLKTTVRIYEEVSSDLDIQIMIREHIPSGIYVDLHQTKASEAFGGPMVYSPNDIDVEKPEHLSPQHDVFVFSTLSRNDSCYHSTIVLSIHLRYHRPEMTQQFTQVILPPPAIHLKITEVNSGERLICDNNAMELCTWRRLDCYAEDEAGGELTFFVPVGDQMLTSFVVITTLTVTVAATLFLSYSALSKHEIKVKMS